jgi:hypothetical protein
MICILEDDEQRTRQFLAAAKAIAPGLPVRIWRSAHAMIQDLPTCLAGASLISLDHDLAPCDATEPDPGCGHDVAQFLQDLNPTCPVIIHTSNVERGTWMIGALSLGGWTYERVYPFGDSWIETEWLPVVARLLTRSP